VKGCHACSLRVAVRPVIIAPVRFQKPASKPIRRRDEQEQHKSQRDKEVNCASGLAATEQQ